jgi:hypothetical protein
LPSATTVLGLGDTPSGARTRGDPFAGRPRFGRYGAFSGPIVVAEGADCSA